MSASDVDLQVVKVSSGKKLFVDVTEGPSMDAPAIFFMHGLGSSTSFWEAALHDSKLSKTYRLVRYDFDGHGISPVSSLSYGNEAGNLSLDDLAEDLMAVMEFVGVEKAAGIVGHSLSGLVASKFAARFPDKVDKLVLVGAMRALDPTAQINMLKRATAVQTAGLSAIVQQVTSAALSDHTKKHSPLSAALVRSLVLATRPAGYAAACHALAGASNPDYSRIEAKSLVVAGEHDYISNGETTEFLLQQIKGAEKREMKDIGHWHAVEDPITLRTILEEWFL
ncbi:hypothetical protein JCM11641_007853 [Rhodosporidiobolus odoratus]